MNIKLLLILFLLPISLFAGKYDLTVRVVNSYFLQPVENCTVTIEGTPFKGKTNNEGAVTFEGLKDKGFTIVVTSSDLYYPQYLNFNLKHHGKEILIELTPTMKYEEELYRIEDSIYGTDNDSTDLITDMHLMDSLREAGIFKEAQYFGGAPKLSEFIRNTVNYPDMAIELHEQGKVYVTFIVEKNGAISHVKIGEGVSTELDCESKRVVRRMPKWEVGTVEDKPVRTKVYLPIAFVIQ